MSANSRQSRGHRRAAHLIGGGLALVVLAAGVTTAGAAPPTAEPPPSETASKIEPSLRRQLDVSGDTDFWVRFEARADLDSPDPSEDWAERGARVARELRKTAEASQADVRAELDRAGVEYTAFWATNAIHVRDGSESLATTLAARPEVDSVRPETQYAIPKPGEGKDLRAVNAVEWGIANINADDVWAQYDVRGAGITIANIDTGVQYDHPALVGQYRGNQGDGTFDHDYNWFDAAGACADAAPCDWDGHGTHTMGTMAGDDGADNHIGVAPGVRWIAANGCCPSDAALIASGQWMLEPTDLKGQNPDASKRPHIINNSWGTRYPSNDPFMEDVSAAWSASGIFAVWSNGNNAPGCKTAASPGSRIINYSVGAYDENLAIAGFSSRGSGQDGETKPNISAPGVNVRSSIPGNRYKAYGGTSMAAPHVAGTVALLWSGAPSMVGDLAGTRDLLDGSAVDTPDDECGGTPEDNNVFGEGRLDALALLDNAPVGETGTLRLTVTGRGKPVAGATVTLTGPNERERVTDADGGLTLPLRVGDYTMKVTAFGYAEQTRTFSVTTGKESTVDISLRALRTVTVSGTVRDGSGQGWPLYAKITVDGMPGGTFHTDPADGRYRITVPANDSYTLTVESRYGGYRTVTEKLTVGRRDVRHDVRVPVDVAACTAPGYRVGHDGLVADFEDAGDWSVVDHKGNGQVWRFDNPGKRTNKTGSDGAFAIMDSEFYGYPDTQDTSLISPAVDLSDQSAPTVSFRQDYDDGVFDVASVDVSIDDGATWQNVFEQNERVRGPSKETIALPQAAHQSKVRVRFHYVVGHSADWWQVDDVRVGTRLCLPVEGGLVAGHVTDDNTGQVVNGATVTRTDAETTESLATPEDPAVADGFYWLFAGDLGRQRLTASHDGYQPATERPYVARGKVTWADFELPAGRLSIRHDDVTATVKAGRSTERTITVTNTGSAPATMELGERAGTFELTRPDGSTMTEAQIAASAGAPVRRIPGEYSPLSLAAQPGGVSANGGRYGPPAAPWVDLPAYPISIMDNTVADLDGAIYSVGGVDGYTITDKGFVLRPGASEWEPIADLPEGRENAAGAFIDGKLYVSGGWAPNLRAQKTTFVYDPETDTWGQVADAPMIAAAAGRAVHDGKLYLVGGCTNACDGTDVRRYDPKTDTWEVLAEYPTSVGHLACAPLKGQIYCAGGIRRGGITWNTTYAYDPAANTWTRKADLPVDLWGMAYTGSHDRLLVSGGITGGAITNEGFAYDPDTDSWTSLPASNTVTYRGGSTCGLVKVGGSHTVGFHPVIRTELLPTYGACAPADVSWLSVDTDRVTLRPGERVRVKVRLSGTVSQPGTYTAGIWVKEDTPYLVAPVDVVLHVRRSGRP